MMQRLITIAILFFITVPMASAQRKKIENLPAFDQKKLHFGFSIGLNTADFVVDRNPNFFSADSLLVLEPESAPGFNLGIIADYHLSPVFSLRLLPTLSFVQRNLAYTFREVVVNGGPDTRLVNKPVESTFLEFPLLLKYRSARLNNFAAYVIGGFNYRLDLVSQENVNPVFGQEQVRLNRHDFAYELGVGFDFFMEYFKLSTELKFSFGIPDILIHDQTIYSNPIRKLSSRIFVLSFHFEG
jgi:hypothetical protein